MTNATIQIQQLQNHTGALIEIPRDISDQRNVVPLRILGNYQSSQVCGIKVENLEFDNLNTFCRQLKRKSVLC